METGFYYFLVIIMGASISIYLSMSGVVGKITHSPLIANILFYFFGLLISIIILVLFGDLKSLILIRRIPPILLLAGVTSAFMVLGTIYLLPILGARKIFLLQVSGQVIMAVIISHLGILGSPKDPITLQKIIGAGILILGMIISLV